jgi:hypothetical protein
MSASMLGSLSCSYAGVCCWLVVALLLPAQVCAQTNTARYSLLGMFDRVNTQTNMHTYIRALAGFTDWSAAAVCRLF